MTCFYLHFYLSSSENLSMSGAHGSNSGYKGAKLIAFIITLLQIIKKNEPVFVINSIIIENLSKLDDISMV